MLRIFLTEEPLAVVQSSPLDDAAFRQYVLAKLSFLMGANMIELARGFLAQCSGPPLEACLPSTREIVLAMHEEQLVCASPWNDDIYLTIGPKA